MSYSAPTAKVIAASASLDGDHFNYLYTVEAKIHRFVLAELNTHRVFSRNSASSRAIPIAKQIASATNDPSMPLSWGSNKPGMQAGDELSEKDRWLCQEQWLEARNNAVKSATSLSSLGLHKQVVNRLLEPFLWHTVIISSTEWKNFFKQRCHKDAQPEIKAAAEAIKEAMEFSLAPLLFKGEWHLPYILPEEKEVIDVETLKKCSVARCARVSYNNHDGTRDIEKDLELYTKLVSGSHFSPFEHVATPGAGTRNFKSFVQLRESVD